MLDSNSTKLTKLKLVSHKNNLPHYKDEELIVNCKDLNQNVKEGDVVEIYDPEADEEQPRLLLQIPHLNEDNSIQKDTISIEHNIANTFLLHPHKYVIVNKIDPKAVSLDLLELMFKDQYLGRSEMWRLKKTLVNTAMYTNKKVEFCNGSIRCQVYEMWAQGEKVACGVVSEDTKVVFRSSTCQAYLFIQMSSEMWEFDWYGDLYFEKAINGFLSELFNKWKKEGSNHDVTIVLFSRTYYKASTLNEFPLAMRECLQEDYQGRFYEDFYRVVIQNERSDDWCSILSHLRSLFHSYLSEVLFHHTALPGEFIPPATNSNASQGNFLEVLNVSLNVFEKHYQDRSFDRTGQMSVVITPGVGIFEVDRELTNITKQRIIDNGVGSDLVCVGEQPLHAVPLLKFHKKRDSFNADDYSMPHTWINLSFYTNSNRVAYGTFIPRIKVPGDLLKNVNQSKASFPNLPNVREMAKNDLPNSLFDYDAYDAQIFKLPSNQNSRTCQSLQRNPTRKKTMSHCISNFSSRANFTRKLSDPDLYRSVESVSGSLTGMGGGSVSSLIGNTPAINIPARIAEYKYPHSFGALNIDRAERGRARIPSDLEDLSPAHATKFGSSGAASPNDAGHGGYNKRSYFPHRSLINPFDPSHVTVKLTSNLRRWIHIFPKDPRGVLVQQHHNYHIADGNISDDDELNKRLLDGLLSESKERVDSEHRANESSAIVDEPLLNATKRFINDASHSNLSISSSFHSSKGISSSISPGFVGVVPSAQITNKHTDKQTATFLWGATGEQEWDAQMTTGVDWKSLTIPACLPLTNDYFPDKQSLHYDYEVAANYTYLPDNCKEAFLELISQRLSQGFQLIVKSYEPSVSFARTNKKSLVSAKAREESFYREYKLYIGRFYHVVQYSDSGIDVTIYRPRHLYAQLERRYKYRFQSPYTKRYELSEAEFKTESLEKYKWNHLDNYICFKGDPREHCLLESFKYWRFRLLILPEVHKAETRRLIDSLSSNPPADIYHSFSVEEKQSTIEKFLWFLEFIHGINVKGPLRRQKKRCVISNNSLSSMGSKGCEKNRRRSGNKSDKSRKESGNKDECMRYDWEDEAKEEVAVIKMKQSQPLSEIIEAMCDPVSGVPFIPMNNALPKQSFIAADATKWVLNRIDLIETERNAVEFLQKLLAKNLIRRVSGQTNIFFMHGFYIYYFISGSKENDYIPIDPIIFQSEWHEVAIEPSTVSSKPLKIPPTTCYPNVPLFLQEDLQQNNSVNKSLYHTGRLEIDVNSKSDRCEWGHLKYQATYEPSRGYEMVVMWMCATGTLLNELLMTWQRKAVNNGLHLFPIPSDPFALPNSYNSNPLRGPIVIPLCIEYLTSLEFGEPFHQFPPSTHHARLILFQEAILERFGFMKYQSETSEPMQNNFVHVTGNIFVLINTSDNVFKNNYKSEMDSCSVEDDHKDSRPQFWWTFNYMLSKRWKNSSISGDEILCEHVLKDFRNFCCNQNNRLRDFWETFRPWDALQYEIENISM